MRAKTPSGTLEITADLVIGADGRESTIRREAKLPVEDLGAPIDVLWMRFSRHPSDPGDPFAQIKQGQMTVLINRETYWQTAFVIPKGALGNLKAEGFAAFQHRLEEAVPFLEGRSKELTDWEDVKVLTVKVDRLRQWFRPGVLCIGDSAHAMSPVGGVGINLAIQDAVAAANLLADPLQKGAISTSDLKAVQKRRELPARITQRAQVFIHNRVIRKALDETRPLRIPLVLRLLDHFPLLRRIPAWLVGIGFRAEHVKSSSPSEAGLVGGPRGR